MGSANTTTGAATGGRRAGTRPDADAAQPRGEDRNEVRLRGRLSADAEERVLPSGDAIVLLRVVVRRRDGSRGDALPVVVGPAPARGSRRRPGQASAAVVRRAAALRAGDVVEADGWLQRRFWAGADGRRTRLEVVATEVRRARRG